MTRASSSLVYALAVAVLLIACKGKDSDKAGKKSGAAPKITAVQSAKAEGAKKSPDKPSPAHEASAKILARRLAVQTQKRVVDAAFFKSLGDATALYLVLVYAPVLKAGDLTPADRRWLDKRLKALVNERIGARLEAAISGFFSADELRAILTGKKSATAKAKMPRWGGALRAAIDPFKLSIRRQLRGEFGRRLPGDDGAKIAMSLERADAFVDSMRDDRVQQLVSGMTVKRLATKGKTLATADLQALKARIAALQPTMRVTVSTEALAYSATRKRADYEQRTIDTAGLEKMHRAAFGKWVEKTVTGLVGELSKAPATKATAKAARARFMLVVEAGFFIKGRGVVATGKVLRGTVTKGDFVEIVGFDKTRKVRVLGLEAAKRILKSAFAGTHVGMLLQGVKKGEIKRGQVLAAPGSMRAYSHFSATIAHRKTAAGGRAKVIGKGYKPMVRFWNAAVSGAELKPTKAPIAPGKSGPASLSLAYRIAMEVGTRFEVREGSQVVAEGVVTKVGHK